MGAGPVSSEGPSSILDVSAGVIVSISSSVSMVGQGSKVGRVSFAQPIVSSVVSVDELDDRAGTVSPSVERVDQIVLRNGSGSSCSSILDAYFDVRVQAPKCSLSDSQAEHRLFVDSSLVERVDQISPILVADSDVRVQGLGSRVYAV